MGWARADRVRFETDPKVRTGARPRYDTLIRGGKVIDVARSAAVAAAPAAEQLLDLTEDLPQPQPRLVAVGTHTHPRK